MSARTLHAGVIGWPVAHSLSPKLHGHWIKRHGLDADYKALPVKPEELESSFKGFKERGYRGFNVTIPHKEAILPLMDALDDKARAIGAVNTVVLRADGRAEGRNTDATGFWTALCQKFGAENWAGKKAVLLGAGGAARAAMWALAAAGLAVVLVNRHPARARQLLADLGRGDPRHGVAAWEDLPDLLRDCDLLINSTSLGMAGQPPLCVDVEFLPARAIVYDLIYNPLETQLLQDARARDLKGLDGLDMLMHQAAPGFEAWFGVRPEVDPELRALLVRALQP